MKNKKVILLILAILAVLTLVSVLVVQKLKKGDVVVVNSNETVNQNVNEIVEKEPEIIDGVDISDWKTYVNEEVGFSLKYPATFDLLTYPYKEEVNEQELIKPTLAIIVTNIDNIKDEEYKKYLLEMRSIYEKGDFFDTGSLSIPVIKSQRVLNIDGVFGNAALVMDIMHDYDDCNIFFSAWYDFFYDNYRISVVSDGPTKRIVNEMIQFFKNEEVCKNRGGKAWVKPYEKEDFYEHISSGINNDIASEWFNDLEEVIQTIKFN